jgi:hypothetical protein
LSGLKYAGKGVLTPILSPLTKTITIGVIVRVKWTSIPQCFRRKRMKTYEIASLIIGITIYLSSMTAMVVDIETTKQEQIDEADSGDEETDGDDKRVDE